MIQRALRAKLGRLPPGSVHIVLSTRDQHEGRFPAQTAHLAPLVDEDEIENFDDVEAELNRRFGRAFYAHAVATEITTSLAAPAAAAIGRPGVFLDMDTIGDLAASSRCDSRASSRRSTSRFPASSGDWTAVAEGKPLPKPRWWQIAPPRECFRLASGGRTEILYRDKVRFRSNVPGTTKAPLCRAFWMPEEGLEPPTRGL